LSEAAAVEGSLAQRDFPHLVQDLAKRRWSGVLVLTHRGVRNVVVHQGRLVFATSSDPDDRLGELLLRRGRISLRQLVDAGRAVRPGQRLGTILVHEGVLTPKELVASVIEHTQEIIYGAFQWTEGRFRLEAGNAPDESITLNMRTPDLILEGIQRIEAWSRVERGMGGIGARYLRSPHNQEIARGMNLGAHRLDLLNALETERSVEDLCASLPLSDFEICQTLWAFGVIGVARRTDTPPTEADDEGLGLWLSSE
jgi:Domain of unknown function (DUF4388)